MTKRTAQDCPTCGRSFYHLSLHICVKSPDVAAWLAATLPNPNRPGYIISRAEYDCIPNKPIDSSALRRAYVSWNALAHHYNLRCYDARGGQKPGLRTDGITGLDPESMAELQRLSIELHDGKFGPSYNEYNTHSTANLRAGGLRKRHGGSWAAVLAAANMQPASRSEYMHGASQRRTAKVEDTAPSNKGFDRGDEPISREYTGLPVLPNPRRTATGGIAWTVR